MLAWVLLPILLPVLLPFLVYAPPCPILSLGEGVSDLQRAGYIPGYVTVVPSPRISFSAEFCIFRGCWTESLADSEGPLYKHDHLLI